MPGGTGHEPALAPAEPNNPEDAIAESNSMNEERWVVLAKSTIDG